MTPLERMTAIVHNDVHREKTGKDCLSEADLHVLTSERFENTSEMYEYNRYVDIVNLEDMMKMDAEMFLYRSELSLLRNQRVLDSFLHRTQKCMGTTVEAFAKDIPPEESTQFLTKHTYLDYEKILHIFTFHNLPKDIQRDLLLLDEEAAHDPEYFENQTFLYERCKAGGTLGKEDKDLIIERIYSCMYHEGVTKMRGGTAEKDGFLPHAFFAELPVKDLLRKVAGGEDADTEDKLLALIDARAKNNNVSMEKLIKTTLREWLDTGLFTSEYVPLCTSERFNTWNGNTKKNHKSLFMAWYAELKKSKQFFQKLLDAGKIEKKTITMDFLGVSRTIEILTGDSLYACSEHIDFVQEYKRQIEILAPAASMFLFAKKYARPGMNHRTLCGFKNLAQKISAIFGVDMTERYAETTALYKEEVELCNLSLRKLVDIMMGHLHTEGSLRYVLDIEESSFVFDLDANDGVADIFNKYAEKFEKLRV